MVDLMVAERIMALVDTLLALSVMVSYLERGEKEKKMHFVREKVLHFV